ncbi:MAG: hypothetical protein HN348_34115, partial [Proteobacteria bacterium]|nr:hypothetical protein [Pseudomonadota bacterium]
VDMQASFAAPFRADRQTHLEAIAEAPNNLGFGMHKAREPGGEQAWLDRYAEGKSVQDVGESLGEAHFCREAAIYTHGALAKEGYESKVVFGTKKITEADGTEIQGLHAWVELSDGTIVDATVGRVFEPNADNTGLKELPGRKAAVELFRPQTPGTPFGTLPDGAQVLDPTSASSGSVDLTPAVNLGDGTVYKNGQQWEVKDVSPDGMATVTDPYTGETLEMPVETGTKPLGGELPQTSPVLETTASDEQPAVGPTKPLQSGSINLSPGDKVVSGYDTVEGTETQDRKIVLRGVERNAADRGLGHESRAMYKLGLSEAEAAATLQSLRDQHGEQTLADQHLASGADEALTFGHGSDDVSYKANSPLISTTEDPQVARGYGNCVYVYDVPRNMLVRNSDTEQAFMGPSMQKYAIGTLGKKGDLIPLVDGKP